MPIAESVALSYTFLAAISSAAVATLAASTPNAEDAWAVTGALFAGFITIVHAMASKRSMLDLACVLIAAAFIGSITPGAVVSLYFPEYLGKIAWHVWAGAGFISGLAGWSLTRGLISFFESINWLKALRKKTGLEDTDKDNPKP